jgi:hypothetical protein
MTSFPCCGWQQGYERVREKDCSILLISLASLHSALRWRKQRRVKKRGEEKDSVTAFKNIWDSSYTEPGVKDREFFTKGIQLKRKQSCPIYEMQEHNRYGQPVYSAVVSKFATRLGTNKLWILASTEHTCYFCLKALRLITERINVQHWHFGSS